MYSLFCRYLCFSMLHNSLDLFYHLLRYFFRFGSAQFLILLVVFTLATSLTYVGLAWLAKEFYESYSYMKQCAIGFSGEH